MSKPNPPNASVSPTKEINLTRKSHGRPLNNPNLSCFIGEDTTPGGNGGCPPCREIKSQHLNYTPEIDTNSTSNEPPSAKSPPTKPPATYPQNPQITYLRQSPQIRPTFQPFIPPQRPQPLREIHLPTPPPHTEHASSTATQPSQNYPAIPTNSLVEFLLFAVINLLRIL